MTEPGTWQDLRAQFLVALTERDAASPPDCWLKLWHILACHSWVQVRLNQIASGLLRRSRLPIDLQPDLVHDALILLATHLRRVPDLQYDRTRPPDRFPAWMSTILKHHCQDAVRCVRHYYRRTSSWPGHEMTNTDCRRQAGRVAMSLALDDVPEPAGSVVRLYVKGHTRKNIAQLLEIPYADVRRLFREAVRRLRQEDRDA